MNEYKAKKEETFCKQTKQDAFLIFENVSMKKLTHLVFTLFIFDPLKDVVDDATSGSVVEKSVFVVDNKTVINKTEVNQTQVSLRLDPSNIPAGQILAPPPTDVSSIG